ncbi:MAG: HPr-rel-A system PqqD family protein [Rhizorhabdus sp.]|nr:HPr-rel-A system PqqD family protein [Rhizorhabdus sp.]
MEVEGLTLLFHRRSGTTHILNIPMPEMLALLADTPCDAATLTGRLCAQLDLTCDDEARQVVEARLSELSDIGLVRRI